MREGEIESIGNQQEVDLEETERYGTLNAWARELGISPQAIQRRIRDIIPILGKELTGKVSNFWPESAVYEACRDFTNAIKADNDGFVVMNGERYASCYTWALQFGLSEPTIRKRVSESASPLSNIRTEAGNMTNGTFFREEDVRKACSDLLVQMPIAQGGFFKKNGMRYGNVAFWSRKFKLAYTPVARRLKKYKGITAKDSGGNIWEECFFSETQARESCSDLLRDIPKASKSGFFLKDGIQYGTLNAWLKKFKVKRKAVIVKEILKLQGIDGKGAMGHVLKGAFYPEDQVREVCGDMIERFSAELAQENPLKYDKESLPVADGEGGIILEDVRYMTKAKLKRIFGVSELQINKATRKLTSFPGIDLHGVVRAFFAEDAVKQNLDLTRCELPKANNEGFFSIEDMKYGTRFAWSEKLRIDPRRLNKASADVRGVDGLTRNGNLSKEGFLSEDQVRHIFPLSDFPEKSHE